MAPVDDEIDQLFDVPLAEFVAARNALAKKISQAGDKAKSEDVKKLAKPAVSAWALNQLARKFPDELREYFEASDRLFRAQVRAMSAGGADPDFRPATEAQRGALNDLVDRIGPVLEASGHKETRSVIERVAMTLRSAVLDEAARKRLREGRMIEDLAEAGFDAFAAQLGAMPEAPRASPPPAKAPEKRAEKREEDTAVRARRAEEERAAKRDALKAAKDAQREAERASSAAKNAKVAAVREAEAKRRIVEEAKKEAKAAQKVLDAALLALGAKEAELAKADKEVEARERDQQAAETAIERAKSAVSALSESS